ncbi:MAG TPA: hypothetical protein VHY20_11420, partial [Pirellulales bacterium]|nr:hypothetical protein [Pirellulales bacterium]
MKLAEVGRWVLPGLMLAVALCAGRARGDDKVAADKVAADKVAADKVAADKQAAAKQAAAKQAQDAQFKALVDQYAQQMRPILQSELNFIRHTCDLE